MIDEFILESLTKFGDNILLEDGEKKYSYLKLLYDINGLKINSRLKYSISLKNSYEFVVTFLALIISHEKPLLLNPQIPEKRSELIIDEAGFDYIINESKLLPFYKSDDIKYNKKIDKNEDEVAFYLLSSGTTGNPKIVGRSHRALEEQSNILVKLFELDEESKLLAIPPFFHSYGIEAIFLNCIKSGGRMVIPDKKIFGFSLAKYIDDMNCTHIFGNPPFIKLLIKYKKENPDGFKNIKKVISGGSVIEDSIAEEFNKLFDLNISTVYGLSEVGCVSFSDDKRLIKSGWAGKLLPGYIGKTTDIDGKSLKNGERGIIWIKKPYNDFGYLNSDELNRENFIDGWFKTGDLGYIDDNNEIFLTGVRSDKINIGGEKVDPGFVEIEIMKINGVIECVVFPTSHAIYGNILNCVIYSKNIDESMVREFLSKRVENVAIPTNIIISSEPLKRTGAGKISRILYP